MLRYDPKFDMSDTGVQEWLRYVCHSARNETRLLVRSELPCWIDAFAQGLTNVGDRFPVSPALLEPSLISFFSTSQSSIFRKHVRTVGPGHSGRPYLVTLAMKINLRGNEGSEVIMAHREYWEAFLTRINQHAPSKAGTAFVTNAQFVKADIEQQIVGSTVFSWLLSNGICLAVVLLFTQNVLISLYTMGTIVLIVVSLVGFLFSVFRFTFGAVEALGVSIFVGLSVDYCLHLAHGYHASSVRGRRGKTAESLTHLGSSVIGAAVTTIGSCSFLFPCRIYLFQQLGIMLTSNAAFAVLYSFVFLCSMLMIMGPERLPTGRDLCDLRGLAMCDLCRSLLQRSYTDPDSQSKQSKPGTANARVVGLEMAPSKSTSYMASPLHSGENTSPISVADEMSENIVAVAPAASRTSDSGGSGGSEKTTTISYI